MCASQLLEKYQKAAFTSNISIPITILTSIFNPNYFIPISIDKDLLTRYHLMIIKNQRAEHIWLVQSRDDLHPRPEFPEHEPGIIPKPIHDLLLQPAAFILKHLRMIPVVQCDHWCNVSGLQLIQKAVIKTQAVLAHVVRCATWQKTWPGQREAEVVELHERIGAIVTGQLAMYF